MKILFLGNHVAVNLSQWLTEQGEDVTYLQEKVTLDQVKKLHPDFIISYNYPHILSGDIIRSVNGKAVNLHISYLPWNRGSYPNVWSFLYDTPKGVTIILMAEKADRGDILVQRQIRFDENKETLKTSYDRLHEEMQDMFKESWDAIKKGKIRPQRQSDEGAMYRDSDFLTYIQPLLGEKGWDIPIKELKAKFASAKLGAGAGQ